MELVYSVMTEIDILMVSVLLMTFEFGPLFDSRYERKTNKVPKLHYRRTLADNCIKI